MKMRRKGGIRIEGYDNGRDFRIDEVVTRRKGAVRTLAGYDDRPFTPDEDRRFVAFDGLLLAARLAGAERRMMYAGSHLVYQDLYHAVVAARTFGTLTMGELRGNMHPDIRSRAEALYMLEAALPERGNRRMMLDDDVRSVGLVAELQDPRECTPDTTGLCVGKLALAEALTPPSLERTVQMLNLFFAPGFRLQ